MPSRVYHDQPTPAVNATEPSQPRAYLGSRTNRPERGCGVRYLARTLPPIYEETGPELEELEDSAAVPPKRLVVYSGMTRWSSGPLDTCLAQCRGKSASSDDVPETLRLTRCASDPLETLAQLRRDRAYFEEAHPTLTRWTGGPLQTPAESSSDSPRLEDVQRFNAPTGCTSGSVESLDRSPKNSAPSGDLQHSRRSPTKFLGRNVGFWVCTFSTVLAVAGAVVTAAGVTEALGKGSMLPADRGWLLAIIGVAVLTVSIAMGSARRLFARSTPGRPGVCRS
ncbi:hypothetical protein HPB50_004847 [Hyalomma asiaticum]|uniref:Uncharacterized protein n=1 Tax=Hyalomma asiaticum TaxID=266040 RepID=A0ACB7SEJ3_HYAAI|nr:hypothetical protein HPB50_004847 [Hyalomma asiaticum]